MEKLIPTRYDSELEFGGSTKPWTVWAISQSGITTNRALEEIPYVVKLFSPSIVKQHRCIAKEFICNFLAAEFDLFTPPAGIINLNSIPFLETLTKRQFNVLKERHQGPTFASRYLGGTLATEDISSSMLSIDEKAMVYAFDSLILNVDRWGMHKKPNLIIHDEKYMLIDHELSLNILDGENRQPLQIILHAINNGRLFYNYKNHLFYNVLRNLTVDKSKLFDTFNEYLANLNIYKLKVFIGEIMENEIEVGAIDLLFEYLQTIKRSPNKFKNALIKSIT